MGSRPSHFGQKTFSFWAADLLILGSKGTHREVAVNLLKRCILCVIMCNQKWVIDMMGMEVALSAALAVASLEVFLEKPLHMRASKQKCGSTGRNKVPAQILSSEGLF